MAIEPDKAAEGAARASPLEKSAAVPVSLLLAYGAPALPLYALLLLIGFFPYYYKLHLGIEFATAGILVLVTRLWDVFTDPLIGILSDRTRLPLGRRRPWLLAGLPVAMLGIVMVLFAEPGISPIRLGLWTMLLFLGWTMMALPLNAWSVAISGDYHQRARISAFREGFSLLGTVAALALLVQAVSAMGGDLNLAGDDIGAAFRLLGIGLLIALPITVWLALVLVPDPRQPGHRPRQSWYDLRDLARNGPLKRLSGAFLINGIANGLPPTLFIYYVQAVLDAPNDVGFYIMIYFLCGILGVPLWTRLSKTLGKDRTWMLAMGIAAAAFVPVAFLGPADHQIYLALVVITGFCLGADFFLPPAMAADVVDLDEVYSGAERAGLFFSLLSMIYKLSWALAGAAGLFALGLSGFDEKLGAANSSSALLVVAVMYALVPALFKGWAIWLMRGFHLDETEHRGLRQKLAATRP
jgi:Na+/melibiose symporter-like transporter